VVDLTDTSSIVTRVQSSVPQTFSELRSSTDINRSLWIVNCSLAPAHRVALADSESLTPAFPRAPFSVEGNPVYRDIVEALIPEVSLRDLLRLLVPKYA
jgi:hypothetical protein